jgi:chaperonin GroEL
MAKSDKKWQTPGVVFQPKVYEGVRGGINTLVKAIRPTLGPLPRYVVNDRTYGSSRAELLDDGGIIARRIIQLSNREEDMGAMYLRQVLWKMHETIGDGTATAAVMFQTIYNEGLRCIVAGVNAMRLRQHLEAASQVILEELESMVTQLNGREQYARLAETICYDPPLAKMLGEIFDIIGAYGRLDVRPGRGRELEREYVEGMYWDGGLFSREFIQDPLLGRAEVENTALLISDLEIKEPQGLLPVLDMAIGANFKTLVVIASAISDRALSVLLSKPNREKIQAVAVKAPARDTFNRSKALEDLALLTSGRAFFQAAGDTLGTVQVDDLGQARRAWADRDNFGITGGRGDPRRLRQHIAQLRSALKNTDEPEEHKRLQERIGILLGGTAVLWVGGNSPITIEARKALAERTAEAMRGALREGVLPGGGIALLACRSALLKKKRSAKDPDEYAAHTILLNAIETPIRTLIDNAGFKPDKVLSEIDLAGPGFGFDARQGQLVDMAQSGIYDAASVVKAATFSAIHGAALALTIDVLIHIKNPPDSYHTP